MEDTNDPVPPPDKPAPEPRVGAITAIRAALKGTVWVAPGIDLTAPTGEVWDAEIQ